MLEFESFAPLFGTWAESFRPFILSQDMYDIYQKLKSEKEKIVPYSDNVFEVFKKTYFDNIKVVWYLQDPYPRMYKGRIPQATGVALDCSNSPDDKLQPSLDVFYDSIQKTTGSVTRIKSLDYLLSQGVMLINTDLTCKLNKTSSHLKLWEPFQKYFLTEIMSKKSGIIYVLSGETSHSMSKYIFPINNYVIKTEHPAAAARRKLEWNCSNVFNKINQYLPSPIIWDYNKLLNEIPF
jgi:uracil DNA glycosylase